MEPPYVGCYDIGMLRYFFLGFLGGILLSLFYILFGSWSWFTPQAAWARAVFAPGLYTGGWAHETLFRHFRGANVDVLASEAVGIIQNPANILATVECHEVW